MCHTPHFFWFIRCFHIKIYCDFLTCLYHKHLGLILWANRRNNLYEKNYDDVTMLQKEKCFYYSLTTSHFTLFLSYKFCCGDVDVAGIKPKLFSKAAVSFLFNYLNWVSFIYAGWNPNVFCSVRKHWKVPQFCYYYLFIIWILRQVLGQFHRKSLYQYSPVFT